MNSRKEEQDDGMFRTSMLRSRMAKTNEPFAPNTTRYFNSEAKQFKNTWEDNAPFSDQSIEYNTHRPYQKNNTSGQWRMGYFQ
jgi:hypothetical protein